MLYVEQQFIIICISWNDVSWIQKFVMMYDKTWMYDSELMMIILTMYYLSLNE